VAKNADKGKRFLALLRTFTHKRVDIFMSQLYVLLIIQVFDFVQVGANSAVNATSDKGNFQRIFMPVLLHG
jgi:hypothetical protein